MTLIDGDDVVQQVAPTTLNPPLSDSVLPRTPERSSNRPYSHRTHRDRDLQPILGIPIEDEKPGSPLIRERLAQLLHDPNTGGMPRDVEMQDTPAVVADDEEAVENSKCEGGTVKKSIAAITSRWLRRKASQLLPPSGSLGARRIQREIVLSETWKPSIKSSPWMRGAPQVEFSLTIRTMRSRTSFEILLLPTVRRAWEMARQ